MTGQEPTPAIPASDRSKAPAVGNCAKATCAPARAHPSHVSRSRARIPPSDGHGASREVIQLKALLRRLALPTLAQARGTDVYRGLLDGRRCGTPQAVFADPHGPARPGNQTWTAAAKSAKRVHSSEYRAQRELLVTANAPLAGLELGPRPRKAQENRTFQARAAPRYSAAPIRRARAHSPPSFAPVQPVASSTRAGVPTPVRGRAAADSLTQIAAPATVPDWSRRSKHRASRRPLSLSAAAAFRARGRWPKGDAVR